MLCGKTNEQLGILQYNNDNVIRFCVIRWWKLFSFGQFSLPADAHCIGTRFFIFSYFFFFILGRAVD